MNDVHDAVAYNPIADAIYSAECVFHDTWTVIPAETGRLFHGKLDSSIA